MTFQIALCMPLNMLTILIRQSVGIACNGLFPSRQPTIFIDRGTSFRWCRARPNRFIVVFMGFWVNFV